MKEKTSNKSGCYKSRKAADIEILKALSDMEFKHNVKQIFLTYCLRVPTTAINKTNFYKKLKEVTDEIPVKNI
jgi:hypothetical protein